MWGDRCVKEPYCNIYVYQIITLSTLSLCSVICQLYLNEVGKSFYWSITYIQKSASIISMQIWFVFTNWAHLRHQHLGQEAEDHQHLRRLVITPFHCFQILDNSHGCTNIISSQLCTDLWTRSHNCIKIAPKCVESDSARSHRYCWWSGKSWAVNCHLEGKRGLPCGVED